MKVWRKQTIRYSLGSKRATKSTPGAKRTKELSKRFYGTLNTFDGRKKQVPLTEDARISRTLLRRLQTVEDEKRANGVDRFYDQRQRKLADHLDDYLAYLQSKNNTPLHVETQAARIRKLLAVTKATMMDGLDGSRILTTLAVWRSRKVKPMNLPTHRLGRLIFPEPPRVRTAPVARADASPPPSAAESSVPAARPTRATARSTPGPSETPTLLLAPSCLIV
jgi:hypothetical protein